METCILESENGLTVQLPATLVEKGGLEAGMTVEISLAPTGLLLSPRWDRYTVEDLIEGMTEDNRHSEWDTGPAVGNEAW